MNEEKKSNIVDLALVRLKRRTLVREDAKPKLVTVADVLAVFPGGRIVNENKQEELAPATTLCAASIATSCTSRSGDVAARSSCACGRTAVASGRVITVDGPQIRRGPFYVI